MTDAGEVAAPGRLQGRLPEDPILDHLRRMAKVEAAVGDALTDVDRQLVALEADIGNDDRARIEEARTIVADTRTDIQKQLESSRSRMVFGTTLEGAVRARARRIQDSTEIAITVDVVGPPVPLDHDVLHDILMVTLEAVNNVVQHAQAKNLRIGIVYSRFGVSVIVEDDGAGFNERGPLVERGIRRMKERAFEHSGSLSVSSLEGWGTTVRATFAVQPTHWKIDDRVDILIADPRPIILSGISALIARTDSNLNVVGELVRPDEAIRAVMLLEPSIAIVGMGFEESTPELVRALKEARPALAVIVLSGPFTTSELLEAATGSGASAVIDSSADYSDLANTVIAVARGRAAEHAWRRTRPDLQRTPSTPLTEREREIQVMLRDGASNKTIAAALGLSVRTVEKHVSAILHKSGVRNRLEYLADRMPQKKAPSAQ